MFTALKSLFGSNKPNHEWKPPTYWQNELHMSAYDRQQASAARQRERIARDTGIY